MELPPRPFGQATNTATCGAGLVQDYCQIALNPSKLVAVRTGKPPAQAAVAQVFRPRRLAAGAVVRVVLADQ
jgi:hypothetical protein